MPTHGSSSRSEAPTTDRLRAGEEPFRTFIRQSQDGIVIVDAQGTIVEWNRAEEELTGVSRAEALGRPLWEIQHRLAPEEHRTPEALGRLRERALRGLGQGPDLRRTVEDEIQRPDGERRTIQSVLFAMQNDGALFACGLARDITERKRADEQRRASEERLALALSASGQGLWDWDVAADRAYLSPEYMRLGGFTESEIESATAFFKSIVHPDDYPLVEQTMAEHFAGETARSAVEYRMKKTSGDYVWVHGVGQVTARDSSGAPLRMTGVIADVSERKRLEQALADVNRRKDEFLAVLSHELRNPLSAVKTSLEALSRSDPGGELARSMQAVIVRQMSHLTHLVDDLLDVTRISRGKIQLKRARVELGDLVRRTLEDHRGTFDTNRVALRDRVATEPLWVDADATRIVQIVGNLLMNAVKFTPGGGHVEVSLVREGEQAVLRVLDSGVGLTPDMLDRLFEPFVQADRTLDRARGGLGLGLALVRGLTELHGGTVAAASEGPERGTVLTVRLPLAAPPESAPAAIKETTPMHARRILVIEDNEDAAFGLKTLLTLDGHEVEVALDGPRGIEKARAFHPDVVLCDLGLPDMDGYEVARILRSEPSLEGALLVALSGYAHPDDLERSEKAGFQRHLAKPLDYEALLELLERAPR